MRAEKGGPGRPEASEAVHVGTGRLRLEGRDHEHPDHQEAEGPQVRRDPAAEHVGGSAAPCAFDGGPGAGADAREHTCPDGRAGRVGSHRQPRSRERAKQREAGETRSQRGHDPHRDARAGRRDDDTGEHRRLRPDPCGAAAGPGGQPHEPDREGHRHEEISEVGGRQDLCPRDRSERDDDLRPDRRQRHEQPDPDAPPDVDPAQQQGRDDPECLARDEEGREREQPADSGGGHRPRGSGERSPASRGRR